MSAIDWLVVGAAGAMIAWVNWYFFFADRQSGRGRGGATVARPARRRAVTSPDREVSDI
jgi:hypothetical protein